MSICIGIWLTIWKNGKQIKVAVKGVEKMFKGFEEKSKDKIIPFK